MALEMAVAEGGMTDEQLILAKKYTLQNFIETLTIDKRVDREDIMRLEKATRGQNENILWKLLRINRITASRCNTFPDETPAMRYGIRNERLLKNDTVLMSIVRDGIEEKLQKRVVEEVLECGLFLSEIGLFSASPDGYFKLETGELVVMEIKCPYTYRNETLEDVRMKLNNTRMRYRIPHTAFSVNRHDTPNVLVEKRNDHYRQIQAQLYVTGAAMAVYMVKFRDMPEIHFVPRDEQCIEALRARELKKLNMYASDNQRRRIMVMEKARLATFRDSGIQIARELAKDGMYWWLGSVICYFCKCRFEVVDNNNNYIHHDNCDKKDNISMVEVVHEKYINVFDRINNLTRHCTNLLECQELAKKGYFYDGSKLVLYCCGGGDTHTEMCNKKTQRPPTSAV
ncbi:alkaline exonuclease [Diatraea saccharalis granulovirus]|uniref:Alkaline exonuclease n=1 Tax=Diatraea saccharalis granulovirus TaxID=1675862 RepID=A0A0R7EYU7_9BBAC|nr:alkaline exonuclease [Diatraea saccharalis granulovirus]AKN80758.1 alkaline exonuclease [Diatraea saccharalis granulovirus]